MAARINSKRNTSPQAPNVNSLHRSQILRDLQAMQAISRIFPLRRKILLLFGQKSRKPLPSVHLFLN
jgi:hypothetical protein